MLTFGRRFERLFPGKSCYYCGDAPNSVDHVVPSSKGGADEACNLVPCCFRCNQMKGTMSVGEFIAKMKLILRTLHEKPAVVIGKKKTIQAGDVVQYPIAA